MSAMAGADPDALEAFAHTARHLADGQRQATRRFTRALDATRGDHRTLAASSAARSLRSISFAFDELAADALRTADGFRSADRVLASLGGEGGTSAGGGSWGVDVPSPANDWEAEWRMPGLPFVDRTWTTDHTRVDLEAGVGPRIEAGAGVGIVDGVLQVGAELEASAGAWVRGAVAAAYGPFFAMANGELFAGATAAAQATVSVGSNGIAAAGEAGAFAGVKASGDVGLDFGPAGVGASGGVSAGVGATVDGDASLGWNRVGFRYELGLTLGLGFELGGEWHVEPRELFDGVVDLGEDVADSPVIRGSVSMAESAFETGKGLLGDSVGAVTSLGRFVL